MKLHIVGFLLGENSEPQNIEYRTAKCRSVVSLCSVFIKIDRSTQKLTTGRIHYSILVRLWRIRFFRVFSTIRLDALAASGSAEP